MTTITGGTVAYEDGVKADQEYKPPKKARVELRFDVPEGQDAQVILATVSHMAMTKVAEMLGQKPPAVLRGATDAEASQPHAGKSHLATETRAEQALVAAEPERRGRGRPPKVKEEAPESPEVAAQRAALAANVAEPQPKKVEDDPMADFHVDPKPEAPVDPMADFDAPAAPVTDADMNSAMTAKCAELQAAFGDGEQAKAAVLIRELVASFNPDPTKPFQARQIPQDKRPTFMARLRSLTKV